MNFGLITGIPRSGTTLAAAILDGCEQTICLSEPDDHVKLSISSRDADEFVSELISLMGESYRTLLDGGAVTDRRHPNGSALTNYFSPIAAGERRAPEFVVMSRSRRGLAPGFLLCSKHNALYTAVLPELVQSGAFKIMAIIRDPLATISSWQSLMLPISSGRLPAGERFWPKLSKITRSKEPLIRKQILIHELFCERYLDQDNICLLRYEKLLARQQEVTDFFGARSTVAAGPSIASRYACSQRDIEISSELAKMSKEGCIPSITHLYPLSVVG